MPLELPLGLAGDLLASIPRPLLAAVLLATPTLAWILYRAWIGPRRRRDSSPADEGYWACRSCASINFSRARACYRCDARRVEQRVDDRSPDAPVGPPDDGVGVPVMAIVESAVPLPVDEDIAREPAPPEPIALLRAAGSPTRLVVVAAPAPGPAQGQQSLSAGAADGSRGVVETVDPEFERLMKAFPSEGRPRQP